MPTDDPRDRGRAVPLAAELQALGGVVGLAGMVNYFLRPVYRAGYAVVRFVARTVS